MPIPMLDPPPFSGNPPRGYIPPHRFENRGISLILRFLRFRAFTALNFLRFFSKLNIFSMAKNEKIGNFFKIEI